MARAGFEPASPQTRDFKSLAYAVPPSGLKISVYNFCSNKKPIFHSHLYRSLYSLLSNTVKYNQPLSKLYKRYSLLFLSSYYTRHSAIDCITSHSCKFKFNSTQCFSFFWWFEFFALFSTHRPNTFRHIKTTSMSERNFFTKPAFSTTSFIKFCYFIIHQFHLPAL